MGRVQRRTWGDVKRVSNMKIRRGIAGIADGRLERRKKGKEARMHDWQKGWDHLIANILEDDASYVELQPKKTPLHTFFESLDVDNKGGLSLQEFLHGLRETCGFAHASGHAFSESEMSNAFHRANNTENLELLCW